MELISIGVKSIKRGPIPDLGTMATVLSVLGNTYKDSASLKEAAQGVFNVDVEESDDPVKQFFTKGAKTLAFSLVDYTPETIQLVKGGIVVGGVWQDPDTVVIIEEGYQVITQTGLLIEIPRASVSAVFFADMKKSAAALLNVTVTPLKPNNPAVKSVNISKYVSPIVSAGGDKPNVVLANSSLVGTAVNYRGSAGVVAWTCTAMPVGAPAPGITTPAALNINITGLVNGVYKFTLTVTDDNGFVGTSTSTVTVALP